jgi:hypothetical protein
MLDVVAQGDVVARGDVVSQLVKQLGDTRQRTQLSRFESGGGILHRL